jgi:hypothetical protein
MKLINNIQYVVLIVLLDLLNIVIEKIFTRDEPYQDIVKFWRDVDQLSIREKLTKNAEYMEDTKKRSEKIKTK